MNKKLLLIPTAAVSAALALGSIAYACTAVSGTMTITSLGGVSGNCTSDAVPQPNTSGNCDINIATSREVVAEATGARPSTAFYMWFLNDAARDQDSMGICMGSTTAKHPEKKMLTSTGTVAGTVSSNSSGTIASTTRYIPSTVTHGLLWPEQGTHGTHNGTASICFMDNGRSYATNDVTVLITGGNGNPS